LRGLLIASLGVLLLAISITPQSVNGRQACNALPFSAQSEQLPFGRPVLRVNAADAPQNIDLVIRDHYEFRNNGNTKLVDWVAYYVDGSTFGSAGQPNYGNDLCLQPGKTFEADPASEDDYANASGLGLARVPLIDPATFGNSPTRFDLDLYSNIVPMHSAFVEQWLEFEEIIRAYVTHNDQPVYVIAGTEYFYDMPSLPGADEAHKIPSGFWKFAYFEGTGERTEGGVIVDPVIKHDGIWFNQTDCLSGDQALVQQCIKDHEDWRDRQVRFVDIEARTKFDFNTLVPNEDEYPSEQSRGPGFLGLDEIELD